MSLKEDFEKIKDEQSLYAERKDVLRVSSTYNIYHFYNFTLRLMITQHDKGVATTPFSKLDAETLEVLRDQLIELGGTPPTLPKPKEENPFKKNKTITITRDGGLK